MLAISLSIESMISGKMIYIAMKIPRLVFTASALLLVIGCDYASTNKSASKNPVPQSIPNRSERTGFVQQKEFLWMKELASPESDADGPTRFELMTECGVDFKNQLNRGSHLKFIETGSGVALGDYDNDGLADIYLPSTDGPNKLYRGIGDFKFEEVTSEAGVGGAVNGKDAWATGATFADIDSDSDLDLFVCNTAAQDLLYVNNADGTFSEKSAEAGLDYKGASKTGSFCDYDHDGDLDMYLLTHQDFEPTENAKLRLIDGKPTVHPDYLDTYQIMEGRLVHAGDADILYRNNGDGTFTDVSAPSGISGYDLGLSVTWFDFNADGWQDIYVGNDFKTPDHLYRNNGDGTFTDVLTEVVHHTPWFSMGADSGDLNNDGLIDMMIADMSGTSHYKQKVNMGDMADSSWFLTYGAPRQYMRNCLYMNTGVGRFLDLAFFAGLESTDWTWSVRFADLDNDGLLDIFVTNGHARNSGDADFTIRFEEMKKTLSPKALEDVGFGIPPLKEDNLAFKNLGDFSFQPLAKEWGLDLNGISHGAAFADFDRDGDLDIVINNLNEQAAVYRNLSVDGDRLIVELEGTESNHYGIGATVEIWQGDNYQVRNLVSIRGYISSDEPILHFGLAPGNVDRLVVTWPGGRQQSFSDLAPNRCYRIVEDDSLPMSVDRDEPTAEPLFREIADAIGLDFKHVEVPFDDYQREPLLPYQMSQLGPGIAWGDINVDGFPDIYIGGASQQAGRLFVNRNGESFEAIDGPWQQDVEQEDTGCLFFDADVDGDLDLLVASGGNEFETGSPQLLNRLYINAGNENFVAADEGVLPLSSHSTSCLAAADFDRDGDLDLFAGSRSVPGKYPITPESQLLINEDGQFSVVTNRVAVGLQNVGMVNSALWSDYNGDGWLDLIIALDWGPITIFQNNEGQLVDVTESLGLAKYTGWWHGIAAGDLDNDGDMDYVVTNHGLNTKYHTGFEHPHRLYFHDFDDSGSLDLVEAEFEGDVEYPVRGRSCSSRAMPFIAEKFGTFHEFALAPIADIYADEMQEVPFLEVTILESVVIWNHGADGFRVSNLPWMAQISPGYGVDCVDFNSDGLLDILIAQNFFGAQPETGFMDGGLGLLLVGKGNREFESVWPKDSGVVLPDDSKGLATADYDRDGDLDALVTVNNGSLRLLKNQFDHGVNRVMEIHGPAGNIAAIGSQLMVSFRDGTSRMFEINAGSSYLSQSDNSMINLSTEQFETIESILIGWPDGKQTTIRPTAGNDRLVIQYPSE